MIPLYKLMISIIKSYRITDYDLNSLAEGLRQKATNSWTNF